MKLLDEIVGLLTNDAGSLTDALLKTKVLLHKVGQGHSEMISWVNYELAGYPTTDLLPDYRKLRGTVYGTVTNGYHYRQNTPIPLHGLPDEHRDHLEYSAMTQSLGVLEKMVNGAGKTDAFVSPLEPQVCQILSDMFTNGYYIQNAGNRLQVGQLQEILIKVRSRLLDFILQLQSGLGDTVNDDNVKAEAAKIDVPSLFAGAVFGDNTTLQIMGSNNHQHVVNHNLKGDREALADKLRKVNVPDADIVELNNAIDADMEHPVAEAGYGPKVKHWIGNMVGKALNGSWEVGIGAATGVLTSALEGYYGL